MSRSNGQGLPPVGVSTRPPRQLNQPSHQPAAPSASDQLSQFRQPQQRPQGYPPQYDSYGQPQTGYPQSNQQSQYGQPTPSYGQQPSPYSQPSLEQLTSPLSQPSSYNQPQPSYGAAPQSSYGGAPQPSYGAGSQTTSYGAGSQPTSYGAASQSTQRTQVPTFEQWSTPASQPSADTRSYDHGGYASPSLDPYQQHGQHAQHGYANAQSQPVNEWGQAAQNFQQTSGLDTSLDPSPYAAEQPAYQQQAMQDHGGEFHDDEEFEDAAPRAKYLRIAAALVGAIVVGGGLAYAYTSLIAPGNGEPPVIKSAGGPNKIKPADAGGKKFANGEKKLMGQLNDGASSSEGDVSGVKRVGTVQVAADGTIIPPAEKPVEAAPEKPVEVDTGFPSTGTTLTPSAPSASAGPQMAAATGTTADQTLSPPRAPDSVVQVAANSQADVAKAASAAASPNPITTAAVAPKPAAEPAVAAPTPPPVKKVAAVAPPTVKSPAAAATASPTGAAGYVAVLASVPVSNTSRINALKQFADMQQKFGTVLQNKTPDVREANLGEKGNYHRLLVGPPGSREGAQALCGSLKAAGYPSDCWVTAY